MREFLRLGGAELREAGIADVGAENVGQCRRLGKGHLHRQARFVFRQRAVVQIQFRRPIEAELAFDARLVLADEGKLVKDERLGQLPWAIASEVEENHAVAVLDRRERRAVVVHDGGSLDKFIAAALRIGGVLVVTCERFGSAAHPAASRFRQQIICNADALPAMVAVHGIETSDDAGYPAHTQIAHLRFDLGYEIHARSRRTVPPVAEAMQKHAVAGEFQASGQLKECVAMFERAVYAGGGAQPHEVNAPAGLLRTLERAAEDFVLEERSVANRAREAHQFLIDDAACADVLVAYFAVAGDAGRQADVLAAGANLRVWVSRHQQFIDRRVSQINGVGVVPLGMRVRTPAVADNERDRSVLCRHCLANLPSGSKWGEIASGPARI